jgi:hypothetical protein
MFNSNLNDFFSYSSPSPFSGQFILPGFPPSNAAAAAAAAAQQLNLNSLPGSQLPQQLTYSPAVLPENQSANQERHL